MTDVIVILDPNFGERLETLLECSPIWIVESDVNKEIYERLWTNRKQADHREKGAITSFGVRTKDSDAKQFLNLMPDVEIHHGRADLALKELVFPEGFNLRVIGVSLFPKIKKVLQESYGFTSFAETSDGFEATKTPSTKIRRGEARRASQG